MRSDEQMEEMEELQAGEDWVIVKALIKTHTAKRED